jgi:transposase InsO family protein
MAHGIKGSMSRKGDCWDNAVAESFFGSLKQERVQRNFLRRAIASVNRDQFRGKNESDIVIWNEGARLTANAIIDLNSMNLSHLLLHFEEVGDEKKAAITRQVSPVAWRNINLSGTYQFASNRKLPDLQGITRPIVQNEVQPERQPSSVSQ